MILVTTPTGQIGGQVLASLLDAGDAAGPVRVVVRDPARLPSRVRDRVEAVTGSHADPDVMAKACAGADRVFWLVPPSLTADSVEGHFRAFTRPLVDAIATQGVERVVAVSTLGRGVAGHAGQISASLAADDEVRATGVHHRALCPPYLMENLLAQAPALRDGGELAMAVPGDRVLRTCATRDIGATAARLLLDGAWTGQADVPMAGPDDLTPEGMARVVSEVLDRPVRFRRIGAEEQKAALLRYGASEAAAQGLADMMRALDEQDFYGAGVPVTPDAAPTGFRQWCEQVLRPAVLG
ncbi:NAD(P)H-binding protein [Streptomyces rubradiris]|uniref:NmrA family transcriptional regulator n=1 Tax=Streptomyces rubradiris TaxID=285531 RepID=A0ABQ3RCM2_STRRR|nr:NAD(P)H-binding protein [Streptomyces rubradiris]GHG93656.1 NmrA family transcriptional regulator [Streptomyces rubradiris]GHI53552.1 NmrA family transcriptional regulator [Streptomyces rubradiris]